MNRSVHEVSVVARRSLALVVALLVARPCASQRAAPGSASDALQKQVARDIGQLDAARAQEGEQANVDAAKAEESYAAGDFAGAAAAFSKRLESRPEDAALLYNLALSAWRAGDLARAEDAIDRYAAAPDGGRAELHQGMLGNIRYREAELLAREAMGSTANAPLAPRDPQAAAEPKDPLRLLEDGVAKAKAACDAFTKSAVDAVPHGTAARNLERALRLQKDLEKKLEDLKKQREQQQQQPDDESKKDGKDKDDPKKDGEQKKDSKEPSKDEQQQKDEGKSDDERKQDESQQQDGDAGKDGKPERQDRPEPKPNESDPQQQQEPQQPDPSKDPSAQKPEPKPQPEQGEQPPKQGEEKPEPAAADSKDAQQQDAKDGKRSDAPGEVVDGAQVSAEQRARMMEQLKELDARMQEIRKATRSKGRPVERDW